MIPSTKSQRQLIGIACSQLGIDKSLKEDMLLARYGQASTCDISKAEADHFLKELRARGFRVVRKGKGQRRRPARQTIPRADGKTVAMVSKVEIAKIAALSALVPWRLENGLELWMKKRLGIEKIRTGNDAYRVIEGLKKMFANHMKKEHGEDWWVRIWTDPGIETFIQEHCPQKYADRMFGARCAAGLVRPERIDI